MLSSVAFFYSLCIFILYLPSPGLASYNKQKIGYKLRWQLPLFTMSCERSGKTETAPPPPCHLRLATPSLTPPPKNLLENEALFIAQRVV